MSKSKIFVNGTLREFKPYEPYLQGRTLNLYEEVKEPKVGDFALYREFNAYFNEVELTARDFNVDGSLKRSRLEAFWFAQKVGEITFPLKSELMKLLVFDYSYSRLSKHEYNYIPDELFLFLNRRMKVKSVLKQICADYGVDLKKVQRKAETRYYGNDVDRRVKCKITINYEKCHNIDSFIQSVGSVCKDLQKLLTDAVIERRSAGYE